MSKRYLYPCVHCDIIYNSRDMETASVCIDGWVDKEMCVYIHNGIPFSHKKSEDPVIWCNMDDGPWRHNAKWNNLTNVLWSHLYVESEKMHAHAQRTDWPLPEVGMGEVSEGDRQVPLPGAWYTRPGDIVYRATWWQWLALVYMWKFLRE